MRSCNGSAAGRSQPGRFHPDALGKHASIYAIAPHSQVTEEQEAEITARLQIRRGRRASDSRDAAGRGPSEAEQAGAGRRRRME